MIQPGSRRHERPLQNGVREELPRYIRQFLAKRKFRMKVEDAFSDHYDHSHIHY